MQDSRTQPANLEAQYDEVLDFLSELMSQRKRMIRRIFFGNPLRIYLLNLSSWRTIFRQDILSSRVPREMRQHLVELATPEERKRVAFKILAAEYPNNAIAVALTTQFPSFDFGKLNKLHDLKIKRLSSFRPKAIVAFVLGISAILLKSIPRSVIERRTNLTYAEFEDQVFIATLLALGYVILVLLPVWVKLMISIQRHLLFGYLLEYCAMEGATSGTNGNPDERL